MGVYRVAHRIGRPRLGKIRVGNLAARVNACVGAACGPNPYLVAAECEDRLFHRLLHAQAVMLRLPPHEWRAIIFNIESIPMCHGLFQTVAWHEFLAEQKSARIHRPGTRALHLLQPYSTLAAGDRQPVVEDDARLAFAFSQR